MIVEKSDEKEAMKIKKIYNHYLDKPNDILKNTQYKVDDVFGDIYGNEGITSEQRPKPTTS